jgi:hypothetical protein
MVAEHQGRHFKVTGVLVEFTSAVQANTANDQSAGWASAMGQTRPAKQASDESADSAMAADTIRWRTFG